MEKAPQTYEYEVALPTPVRSTFTYSSTAALTPGTRVKVPFGPRKLIGVIMPHNDGNDKKDRNFKLRSISSVLDYSPSYSSSLLKLGEWMSQYYLHPIGEVLKTMLPAAQKKTVKKVCFLNTSLLGEDNLSQIIKELFGKKTRLTEATIKGKLKKFNDFDFSYAELLKHKALSLKIDKDIKSRDHGEQWHKDKDLNVSEPPKKLTAEQESSFAYICNYGIHCVDPSSKKPFLIRGVTGSGKTEVYLQLIEKAARKTTDSCFGQSLVLVPEISLTPQMTMVFEKRFRGRVAVVHSAMSDEHRWSELERVRTGEAGILIGPRSAVFAAFDNLQLIIVDEEHDSSYKQTTGLCYNGRDVAVVRGQFENVPVVLGSATPSLESYNNGLSGRYHLLHMSERVSGRELPEVVTIQVNPSYRNASLVGSHEESKLQLDEKVITELKENFKNGEQSIVLVNRRGFAYYLFSIEKKEAVLCPDCSISLTLHSRSSKLRCHYCDYHTTIDIIKQDRPNETFVSVGYGSQKAEDYIRSVVSGARVVRVDSDTVLEKGALENALSNFREHKTDILVGTQILAKGHDFPNVTLIVLLEIDQQLSLPDFRAGERTYQLLVQASGRAGRGELKGRVLLQSSKVDHPVVAHALDHDYLAFVENELSLRKALNYPPFSRMISIELSSEDSSAVDSYCQQIDGWVTLYKEEEKLGKELLILGPAVAGIEVIRRRHRRTLIFSSQNTNILRKAAISFLSKFEKSPKAIRVRVDVDPQSLM